MKIIDFHLHHSCCTMHCITHAFFCEYLHRAERAEKVLYVPPSYWSMFMETKIEKQVPFSITFLLFAKVFLLNILQLTFSSKFLAQLSHLSDRLGALLQWLSSQHFRYFLEVSSLPKNPNPTLAFQKKDYSNCFTENPLKMTKSIFYFTLKTSPFLFWLVFSTVFLGRIASLSKLLIEKSQGHETC